MKQVKLNGLTAIYYQTCLHESRKIIYFIL